MTRLVVVAAVAAAALLLWYVGALDLVREPERAAAWLTGSGALGPLVFVLAFGLLEPFGVPGAAFVLPASAVWPLPVAFLLSWLGSILAGIVGFGFARYLARDFVAARLPGGLRAYDARAGERPFVTVALVRLFFFLAPPAHWALGLTSVRFAPFVLGTAVGFLPGIAALTLGGRAAFSWLSGQPGEVWWALAALAAAVLLARAWRRRYSPANS